MTLTSEYYLKFKLLNNDENTHLRTLNAMMKVVVNCIIGFDKKGVTRSGEGKFVPSC